MRKNDSVFRLWFVFIPLILMLPTWSWGAAFPVEVNDSRQKRVQFSEKPQRVISLAPCITEMLLALGQEKALVGLTREDLTLNSALRKTNVGSYFCPDIEAIEDCRPDLIIASPDQKEVIRHFSNGRCNVMVMAPGKIAEAFSQLELMGRLFDCETEAARIVRRNRDQLALVKSRLSVIPAERRKRVVRVMAGDELACPGDDSFQNEMIRASGGIPPHWGKKGSAVSVGLDAWKGFNPQVIYTCHRNEKIVRDLLKREGWKDVDAVKTGFITTFPCDLTSRISTRVGYFVQWLAAVLYPETFADPETAVSKDQVLERRLVAVDLPYVQSAEVVWHRVADETYKSLVLKFTGPQDLLSTFEGYLSDVLAVGNTFVPMPASLGHMARGVDGAKAAIRKNLGFQDGEYATLMTGADMDNLSIRKEIYEDLEVVACVTAGVKGNAMRASVDKGLYYKHGTINIIVLANRRLTPNAMARAVIAVTEGKSAALLDLDIRSSYTPLDHRATGTGTDNVMVVRGQGAVEKYAGGHTKLGELISRAVYKGVQEAIFKQNGLRADRDLFQRLADRKLPLERIVRMYPVKGDKELLTQKLEGVLMTPFYASFLETALAINDEYRKGLIKDLTFFNVMCSSVAARLSGRSDMAPRDIPTAEALPPVISKAFGALILGVTEQDD